VAEPLVVTLDGPAGVGKSTVARLLAKRLGLAFLDTGAMFRAVAWRLGPDSWTWPEERIAERLAGLRFGLAGAGEATRLLLDGAALGPEIRTEDVGMWASNVAVLPVVRRFLKQAQQDLAKSASLVAEGRDMGSVVFPGAQHKFFLDAEPAERARRRALQLRDMGQEADEAAILARIEARDLQDRTRAEAPLRPAADALVIDTTRLDLEEVFDAILAAIVQAAPTP